MANPLIIKARARMESLLREAQELKEWIERAEHLDKDQGSGNKVNGHKKPTFTKNKVTAGPGPSSTEILDKVAEIMIREKRPMSPQELTVQLNSQGIKVAGQRPAANLSAKLCTAKSRFKRVGYGQWILAD